MNKKWFAAGGVALAAAGITVGIVSANPVSHTTITPSDCHVTVDDAGGPLATSFCADGTGWHRIEVKCVGGAFKTDDQWARAGETSLVTCTNGVFQARTGKVSNWWP